MTRKCILHIGTHKTGSSSIQATFAANHMRLKNKWNLDYYHKIENQGFLASFFDDTFLRLPMYSNFAGPLQQDRIEFRELLRQDFEFHLGSSRYSTHVVSGEGLSQLGELAVSALKAFLYRFFDEVIVVAYVREHLSCLSSLAQQAIKAGRTFADIQFHDNENRDLSANPNVSCVLPNYRHRISTYQRAFGKDRVTIRDYSSLAKAGRDITADFMEDVLGIQDPDLRLVKVNEGLDYTSTHILENLNRIIPPYAGEYLNPLRARALTSKMMLVRSNTKFVMPNVDWNEIKGRVIEDSAWLNEETNGEIRFVDAAVPKLPDLNISQFPISDIGVQLNAALLEAENARQRFAIKSGLSSIEANATAEESLLLAPFTKVCLVHTDTKFVLSIAQRLKRLKYFTLAHVLADNVRRVSPEPEDHAQAAKFMAALPQQDYNAAKLRFDLRMGNLAVPKSG